MSIVELLRQAPPRLDATAAALIKQYPETRPRLESALNYLKEKRFHELSICTFEVSRDLEAGDAAKLLYSAFGPLATRLRAFTVAVAVDAVSLRLTDLRDASALTEYFMSALKAGEKPTTGNEEKQALREALLLLRVTQGVLAVRMGNLKDARAILLDELHREVRMTVGIDPILSARLHRASAYLFKSDKLPGSVLTAKPTEMFNALRLYLAYQRLEELSDEEIADLGRDLLVAALAAPNEFGFGELLQAPVLQGLRTEDSWLLNLITAASKIDAEGFHSTLQTNDAKAAAVFGPHALSILRRKLQVALLLELCFGKSTVPLADITRNCAVSSEAEAHKLLIRAIGAGVVKGRVDGCDGVFAVEWVEPRATDSQRLADMTEAFRAWRKRVADVQAQI